MSRTQIPDDEEAFIHEGAALYIKAIEEMGGPRFRTCLRYNIEEEQAKLRAQKAGVDEQEEERINRQISSWDIFFRDMANLSYLMGEFGDPEEYAS